MQPQMANEQWGRFSRHQPVSRLLEGHDDEATATDGMMHFARFSPQDTDATRIRFSFFLHGRNLATKLPGLEIAAFDSFPAAVQFPSLSIGAGSKESLKVS